MNNSMDNRENKGRAAAKMTQVKKRNLSEFAIKLQSVDGVCIGGEITCMWDGATRKFCDVNELMRFVEERCDAVWYPQAQRKLRGWTCN